MKVRGTIPTRKQRQVLESNGYDATQYLFVNETPVQNGGERLNRTDIKRYNMNFINKTTGAEISIEI